MSLQATTYMPSCETQHDAGTLVIKLGYRGKDFSGFAEQNSERTVAGELRRALETMLHREVDLICAGRTDAGVHAIAQYVSVPVFKHELELEELRVMRTLSALCPDDISIQAIFQAAAGFSARFDARTRSYRYRIYTGESRPVLSWYHAWWLRSTLDSNAMNKAAQCLVGEQDFRSFAKASSVAEKTTIRNIQHIKVQEVEEAGEQLIAIDVCANAFLHNMVRNIVGTLAEVGSGRKKTDWVYEVLAARDRRAAGICAPANGLTLVDVDYPDNALCSWRSE